MHIDELLESARGYNCSDIHLTCNMPPIVRINGSLVNMQGAPLLEEAQIDALLRQMCVQCGFDLDKRRGDLDFCYRDSRQI